MYESADDENKIKHDGIKIKSASDQNMIENMISSTNQTLNRVQEFSVYSLQGGLKILH